MESSQELAMPSVSVLSNSPQFSAVLAEFGPTTAKQTNSGSKVMPVIHVTRIFEEVDDFPDENLSELPSPIGKECPARNITKSNTETLDRTINNNHILSVDNALLNHSLKEKENRVSDKAEVNEDCQSKSSGIVKKVITAAQEDKVKDPGNHEKPAKALLSPSLRRKRESLLDVRRVSSPAALEKIRHQHLVKTTEDSSSRNGISKTKSEAKKIDLKIDVYGSKDGNSSTTQLPRRPYSNLDRNVKKEEYYENCSKESQSFSLPNVQKFAFENKVKMTRPPKLTFSQKSRSVEYSPRSPSLLRENSKSAPEPSTSPRYPDSPTSPRDCPKPPVISKVPTSPRSPVSLSSPREWPPSPVSPRRNTLSHLKPASRFTSSNSCPNSPLLSRKAPTSRPVSPLLLDSQSRSSFESCDTYDVSSSLKSPRSPDSPKIPSPPKSPRSPRPSRRTLPKTKSIDEPVLSDSKNLDSELQNLDSLNEAAVDVPEEDHDSGVTKRRPLSSRPRTASILESPYGSPLLSWRSSTTPDLSHAEIERKFQEFSRSSAYFPKKICKAHEDLTSVASAIIQQASLEGDESGMELPKVADMSDVLKTWHADDRDMKALRHVVRYRGWSHQETKPVDLHEHDCRYLRKINRDGQTDE